jgi:general secretion pathway protein L
MAQQLVAIDVSPKRVRVLLLEATFRKAQVSAALTVPYDAANETPEVLWQKVRALLPGTVDSVIIGADPGATSTRLLSFPFDDVRKVEAALEFELESQIPYPLDSVVTSWAVARRGAGATQILAAVAPREALAAQLRQCAAVDLEPRVMTLAAAVLPELLTEPSDGPVAIASFGETQAHIAVINDKLVFARTVRAGSIGIDRSLAKHYNLDLDKARQAKEREARVIVGQVAVAKDARDASAAVIEGIAPLIRQLTATLKSLPPEHLPKRLYITGGLSRLPGIAELLAERLGLAVQLIDLSVALANVTLKVPPLGPEFANAVALGLALLRRGQGVPLNLRRGPLAYHGDIQFYRGEMLRIGAGLGAVFLLAIIGSIARFTLIAAEETQIDQSFCKATQKIVGHEICDPTAALATLKHSSGGPEGVTVPPYSATEMFEMLSKLVGRDLDVTFDDLEFRVAERVDDPDRITGKGEAASFESTEQIVVGLKKHPCIQDAEVSKQRKTRNSNRVEFSLAVKVACPGGVNPVTAADATTAPSAGATPPLPDSTPGDAPNPSEDL